MFTAAMGPGGTRSYSSSTKIEFPMVLANVGDAYDTASSKFTCPISEVYMFSVTVISQSGYVSMAHIMADDV